MRRIDIKQLPDEQFKRATGLTPLLFLTLVELIQDYFSSRKYSGRPPLLSIEDQLLLTLMYYREYRTLFMIGMTYGLAESTTWQIIRKIEQILSTSPEFQELSKNKLPIDNQEATYLVDATEIAIERPKTDQEFYYSGKKKKTYYEGSISHRSPKYESGPSGIQQW